MNRTITCLAVAAIAASIFWLIWQHANQSELESQQEGSSVKGHAAESARPQLRQKPSLPTKSDRSPVASQLPKITEDDIDAWLDLSQEDWLAQFDEKAPDASKPLRSEIAALLGELKEVRRRGITAEHPMYRARRDAIRQRFYERYTGQTALTDEQIAERRKTLGIVGVVPSFSPEGDLLPLTHVFPGTPAEAAGIEAGDQIIAINGQDVGNLSPTEIGSRLRGLPGETVRLLIRKGQSGAEILREIERGDSDELLPGNNVVR